jgi:hypothetical protein
MPAFYIVLQEEIPGVDAIGLDGRALSKYSAKLVVLARQAGVRSLTAFFSVDREEVVGLLGEEEIGQRGPQIPEKQWFEAEDGLSTVAALLKSLGDLPPSESTNLARELSEFQRVLQSAKSRNIRWHLGIEY